MLAILRIYLICRSSLLSLLSAFNYSTGMFLTILVLLLCIISCLSISWFNCHGQSWKTNEWTNKQNYPIENSRWQRMCLSCSPNRARLSCCMGFPGGSDSKESTCNVSDLASIPGLGRSHGGAHGNPLQYSCLENPMDWTEEPGRLLSTRLQGVGHDWATQHSHAVCCQSWLMRSSSLLALLAVPPPQNWQLTQSSLSLISLRLSERNTGTDFPGSPVVKTLGFHSRGRGFREDPICRRVQPKTEVKKYRHVARQVFPKQFLWNRL